MSLYRDKAVRRFFIFIMGTTTLLFLTGLFVCRRQTEATKNAFLFHDCAVAGSLLEQGVPEKVIAAAITEKEQSTAGMDFLTKIGVTGQTSVRFLPFLYSTEKMLARDFSLLVLLFSVLLFGGTVFYFYRQERLYRGATEIIRSCMENDASRHLPRLGEGAVYEMFSATEQILTMQRAKSESELRAKQFLKQTISDISHQLKTPLAALMMYQEIIEEEPENSPAVKEFSVKMKSALIRMERLIQSMLKITRLDAGSIVFEKRRYQISEIVRYAVGELMTRAEAEKKKLVVEGDESEMLVCDMDWTAEAIGNLVKNALDHTKEGDVISISWEDSLTMLRIRVKDDGCGIAEEDIHHIFKRFYRSKGREDAEGIGLGLPLAKAMIEGQGGVISVESNVGEGTEFCVSFFKHDK